MRIFNLLFVVITIVVLSACGSDNNEPQKEEVNNSNYQNDINNDSEDIDVEFLLEESFIAMQQIDSLYMATELNVVEQYEGEEKTGNRTFDVAMILDEPYSQHYVLYIDDDIVGHYVSGEVYEIGTENYFHSATNEIEWEYFESEESNVQKLAEKIQSLSLDEHLEFADQFEIIDETENEYVLSFNGEFEDIINILYGGAIDMFEKVQMSMQPSDINTEIAEFDVNVLVQKGSYFINGYEINVVLESTESDDYLFETNFVIAFDFFNEYESIEVPDEVIENAVEFEEEEIEEIDPEEYELDLDELEQEDENEDEDADNN